LHKLLRLFNDKNLRFYRAELVNRNEQAQDLLIAGSSITFLVSSENYRRSRERIAVCLSGDERNLGVNLKFLKDFLAGSKVDVFGHFWTAPDRDVIVGDLAPVDYVFEERETSSEWSPDGSGGGHDARLHSFARAVALKKKHEVEGSFVYDVVASISVDVLALADLTTVIDRVRSTQLGLDDTVYVPAGAQGGGLDGNLIIGGSAALDTIAALDRRPPEDSPSDRELSSLDTELQLLRHVLDSGLAVQTFPLDYVVLTNQEELGLDGLGLAVAAALAERSAAPAPFLPTTQQKGYWRAKAESAAVVSEMGFQAPKTVRMKVNERYLRIDQSGGLLQSGPGDEGSKFVVLIAGGLDRSAVNIRDREALVVSADPRTAPVNLSVDRRSRIECTGAPSAEAVFMLSRADGGVCLEWRPGYWRSPSAVNADEQRLGLNLAVGGLEVCPLDADTVRTVFILEPVDDPVVEGMEIGRPRSIKLAPPTSSDTPITRVAWRIYTATRVFNEGGRERLVRDTRAYLRKAGNRRTEKLNPAGLAARLQKRLERSGR